MKELTPTEKVVLAIYKHNKINSHVSFSILYEELKELSRKDLETALDRLFDLCMINAEWYFIDEKWMRLYHTSHAYEPYFEELYNGVVNNA